MKKLFFFLLAGFLCGCGDGHSGNAVEGSGTIELWEHNVGPRVAGKLVTLNVDEGDRVKQGQLLATLERYEKDQKDFLRAKELFEGKVIPKKEFEDAELTFEDQQILSPVDGIVLQKLHVTGEVLAAGTPTLIIGDPKMIWVRLYIPGDQVNRVKVGQPATVEVDGIGRKFKGKVTYVSFQAEFTPRNIQTKEERVMQTFAVKVTLDPTEEQLNPGVPADVVIDVSSVQP